MPVGYSYFCPCPQGLETALSEELQEIATKSVTLNIHRAVPGGVHCSGTLEDGWLLNLHTRIASRVLLRFAQSSYRDEDDIYRLAVKQPWEQWFEVDNTIRIDVAAIKSPLKNLNFATLRVKDAIVDRFRSRLHERPSVDTRNPDIRVSAFLDAHNVTLYLDTSGEALFKRGWRTETGEAPLRENLAAGLIRMSGWKPGTPLLDPMCGSGTILVEAAQMMVGIPPGINRHFAFERMQGFDKEWWQSMKEQAKRKPLTTPPMIFGSDISTTMLNKARTNIANAGIPFEIPLQQIEAQEVRPPVDRPGIILTNPPYGERITVRGNRSMEKDERAPHFYQLLSSTLKQRFAGWSVYLFTADMGVPKMMRLKESKRTPLYNGAIECRLFRFNMVAGSNRDKTPRVFTRAPSDNAQ